MRFEIITLKKRGIKLNMFRSSWIASGNWQFKWEEYTKIYTYALTFILVYISTILSTHKNINIKKDPDELLDSLKAKKGNKPSTELYPLICFELKQTEPKTSGSNSCLWETSRTVFNTGSNGRIRQESPWVEIRRSFHNKNMNIL